MLDRISRVDRQGAIDEPAESDRRRRFPRRGLPEDTGDSRRHGPLEQLAEELGRLGVPATVRGQFSTGSPPYLRVGGADGESVLCVNDQFGFTFGSTIGPITDIGSAASCIQNFLATR